MDIKIKKDYSGKNILEKCIGTADVFKIPSDVDIVAENAFLGCKIKKLIIPNTVKRLEKAIYKGFSISQIEGLETIELEDGHEFYYSDGTCLYTVHGSGPSTSAYIDATAKVKSIVLDKRVEFIGESAFIYNDVLEEVSVDPENKHFFVENGGIYKRSIEENGKEIIILQAVIKSKSKRFEAIKETKVVYDSVFYGNDVVEEIILPENVQWIFEGQFAKCKNLKKVIAPGVKEVVKLNDGPYNQIGCFEDCESIEEIKFGDIKSIPDFTFSFFKRPFKDDFFDVGTTLVGCNSDKDIISVPDGITTIVDFVFFEKKLKELILPDSVRYISKKAFINPVEQASGGKKVDQWIMDRMPNAVNVPNGFFDSFDSPDPDMTFAMLDTVWKHLKNTETYLKLFANKSGKKLSDECLNKIAPIDGTKVKMLADLINDGNPNREYSKLAKFFINAKEHIDRETADQIIDAFEKAGAKAAKNKIVKAGLIGSPKNDGKMKTTVKEEITTKDSNNQDAKVAVKSTPDVKEVTEFVDAYFKEHTIRPEVLNAFKADTVIHYRNSESVCDFRTVQVLLNEYADEFINKSVEIKGELSVHREIKDCSSLRINETADYIFKYLDEEDLYTFLNKLVHLKDYRLFILSYGRFIPESHIDEFISEIKKEAKGKAKAKYWAGNGHASLYLNESTQTVKYLEGKHELDKYAKVRNLTAKDFEDRATELAESPAGSKKSISDSDFIKSYTGISLSNSERNALKKALKAKKIDVHSDPLEREYDNVQHRYVFADHNTMHLGDYVSLYYRIDDDKSIFVESISLAKSKNLSGQLGIISNEINKILNIEDTFEDVEDNFEDVNDIKSEENVLNIEFEKKKGEIISVCKNEKDAVNMFIILINEKKLGKLNREKDEFIEIYEDIFPSLSKDELLKARDMVSASLDDELLSKYFADRFMQRSVEDRVSVSTICLHNAKQDYDVDGSAKFAIENTKEWFKPEEEQTVKKLMDKEVQSTRTYFNNMFKKVDERWTKIETAKKFLHIYISDEEKYKEDSYFQLKIKDAIVSVKLLSDDVAKMSALVLNFNPWYWGVTVKEIWEAASENEVKDRRKAKGETSEIVRQALEEIQKKY